MDEASVLLSLADRMLWIAALVAAPVLIASLAIGLVIGLVQAATSVNEQTLTFVPKLAAVAFVLVVFGASMMALVSDFMLDIFAEIARMGGVIGLDFGFGALEQDMWRVIFLMTRIGAALLAAPFFGAASVPMTVRVSLTGALAIFTSIWLPEIATPPALLSLDGLLAIGGEIIVGLALGFVLQLAFAAPAIAAELIGGGMGMSMAMASDPMGGGTTTAFGQYFLIVLTLIFLATGAHLHWIALVTESYRVFPPGDTWLGPDRFFAIAGFATSMFETGLRIALPVVLILLLVQVLTGVLSRSAPSLNLFALGLPAGVLAGIAALVISAPLIYDQFLGIVERSLEQSESVMIR